MIIEFENQTVEQIVSRPAFYADAYKQHGVIVFKKAYFSDDDVAEIFKAIGPLLGFTAFATDGNGPRLGNLSWPYLQDHDKAIRRDEDAGANTPQKDLIEWHVEGVSMKWPQHAAGWNMEHFTCSNEFGKTGFVDMCKLYNDLLQEEKDFLDKARIMHVPNWQDGDPFALSAQFIDAIHKFSYEHNVSNVDLFVDAKRDKVTMIDGDNYMHSYSRQAVEPHPASGRKTLRVCPCGAPWGIQDHLVLWNDQKPDEVALEYFNEIMLKVIDEITYNSERQMWHAWDEGDLVIPDLFRTAHGVRGGMQEGERRFRGNWCFAIGTPSDPMERTPTNNGKRHHDSKDIVPDVAAEGVLVLKDCFSAKDAYEQLAEAEWKNNRPDSPPESTHFHLVDEELFSNSLYEYIKQDFSKIIEHADEFFNCKHFVYDISHDFSHMKFADKSGSGLAPRGDVEKNSANYTTIFLFLNNDYRGGNMCVHEDGEMREIERLNAGSAILIDGKVDYESRACFDGEKIVAIIHLDRQAKDPA
jgi:alpha-ketoglutarate-dependent taurine dioxygenase